MGKIVVRVGKGKKAESVSLKVSERAKKLRAFFLLSAKGFFYLLSFLLFTVGIWFGLNHVSNKILVFKNVNTGVTSQVIAGLPVKIVVLVDVNEIKGGKHLVKIPKIAKDVKVKQITPEEIIALKKQTTSITLEQKLNIAKSIKESSSQKGLAKNFLGTLSDKFGFLLADGEQALEDVVSAIVPDSNSQLVDISSVVTLDDQPQQPEQLVLSTEISDPTGSDLLQTTSPTDQGVTNIESQPQDSGQSDNSQPCQGDETDNCVAITYTMPAPVVTVQPTDTGQLVTVSATDENPETPLIDVLAAVKIPSIFKVGEESKIHIKWKNNGDQNVIFTAHDTDADGYLDYVEWTIPHLSVQTFEIIFISKAFQLDADQNVQADIYDQVQAKDGTYATITDSSYVRFTFTKDLTSVNDITVYAKPTDLNSPVSMQVYPVYTDADGNQTQGPRLDLASDGQNFDFSNISADGKYRILLSNLQTPTDVFDLKIIGNVDIDYIVDPVGGGTSYYWTGGVTNSNTNTAGNWSLSAGSCVADSGNTNLPGPNDDVHFGGAGACQNSATINSSLSVYNFYIDSTYTVGTGVGTVTASAGVTVGGALTVSAGALAVGTQTLAVTGSSTITGGTLTIGAGVTGWSSAGITIGTGGTVTCSGASKITDSGNWDSSAGIFNASSTGTIFLTGTGTLKSGGTNYLGKMQMAAPGKITTLMSTIYVNVANGLGGLIWGGGTVNFNGNQLSDYTKTETFDGNGTTVTGGGMFDIRGYYSTTTTLTNLNLGTTMLRLDTSAMALSASFILSGTISCGTIIVAGGTNPVSAYNLTLKTAADSSITCSGLSVGPNGYTGQGSFDGTAGGTVNVNGNVDFGTKTYAVDLGSSTWNITGNWANASSVTINPGTSSVNFTRTTAGGTITSKGQSFYNLKQNGAGGTNTLQDNAIVTGALTVTSGTLATSTYKATVNGNILVNGGTLDASNASSDLDVNGNITLTSGTLKAPAVLDDTSFTVAGNWVLSGTGVFTHDSGTVVFDGVSAQTINSGGTGTGKNFNYLTVNNSSATDTVQLVTNDCYLDGKLKMTDGTLDLNGHNFYVGNAAQYSPALASGTTVIVGNATFRSAAGAQADLVIPAGATVTLNNGLILFNNVTIADGTFTCTGTGSLKFVGVGIITSSNFTAGNGSVVSYSGSGNLTITRPLYNLQIGEYLNATRTLLSDLNVTNHLWVTGGSSSGNSILDTNGWAVTVGGEVKLYDTSTRSGNINAGNSIISVAGNWTVLGTSTFTKGSSNVVLNGTGAQVVTSNGQPFNALTVTNASTNGVTFADRLQTAILTDNTDASTLKFSAESSGSPHTISSALNISGGASKITFAPSVAATTWYISAPSPTNVTNVNVSYSSSTNHITPITSIDGGHNVNWDFNVLPTVSNVHIDSDATDVILIGGTTKNVSCTATVSDGNGYSDIVSVVANFYRSGKGAGASDDNGNHYALSGSKATYCSGSGISGTCTFVFPVYYYADSTDTGSTYEAQNWVCQVTPTDGVGSATSPATASIEMDTLKSFDVTSTINYGSLTPGQSTSSPATATVTNTGNVALGFKVSGSSLNCSVRSSVPVANEQFGLNNFSYGSGTVLSGTPVDAGANLSKPTQSTPTVTQDTYWHVLVPAGTKGICSGATSFIAN